MSNNPTPRLAALGALALALVACAGPAAAGSGGGTPAAVSPDVTAAVAKLTAKPDSYPVPTAPVPGVAAQAGKTVYYIPITQQAPQFAVTGDALTAAMKTAGLSVQVCDGGSNPSAISACVTQATAARAGAIITDSVPYALAANALDAARAARVPVLITDQIPDPAHPADATLQYLEGAGTAQLKAVADWIIADSGGSATVVVNQSTDSPSTVAYVDAAVAEFGAQCPGCTVRVNKISSANYPLIASSTSSALLGSPNAGYVVSEFDQYLQPTLGGVQQSGRAMTVKGGSSAAQVTGLQMLEDQNFLAVDAGQASAFQGWASADAALRLMTGTALPQYSIPVRLFTRDNVGDLALTKEAEASGEWFGPTGFPAAFATLWGVR